MALEAKPSDAKYLALLTFDFRQGSVKGFEVCAPENFQAHIFSKALHVGLLLINLLEIGKRSLLRSFFFF